jgi:hypothetical protein
VPISFKSPANSALLNQTFVDKTIDDEKKGRLGLFKNTNTDADAIDDIQDYTNELADTIGQNGEDDPNRKNYANTNFISNGQNRKQAIEALDLGVKFTLDEVNALNNSFNSYLASGSFKIRGYISDNAYETANGTPFGGEIYYNQTTGFIRYYNGIDEEWADVGKTVLGVQETPSGIVDGTNTDFNITNAPLNDEAISVFINGRIINKSLYSFSSPTISFNNAPSLGQEIYVTYLSEGNPATPVISAGTNNVVYRQITSGEITAKQLTLASAPSTPTHVLVDAVGGSTLQFGSDFTITGTTLSWNGLGLDGVIAINDVLRIQYFN